LQRKELMSYQAWQKFAFAAGNTMRRRFVQATLAGAMVILLPVLAGAYTLVLRDGRHLDVPGRLIVTQTTVTYERFPGFNVTLQLYVVDIPATERINHQPPGSFLRLSESNASQPQPVAPHSRVTITNANLEKLRGVRLQNERAYDQRRRELGLPTLEETRRREQQESDKVREELRERILLKENEEAYWRARAGELREELAEVDAQINYVTARLDELPDSRVLTSGPFVTTARMGYRLTPRARGFGTPNRGTYLSGQIRLGRGNIRVRGALNPGYGTAPFGNRRGGFGSFNPAPFGFGFPSIVSQPFARDSSYESLTLSEQLNNLLMTRAGLEARWNLLEEEARRNGAPPGWLRP
jgi:hypothetical protein